MGVITSSSASDTTPTQFFLYILALDIYLCPICLVLGPIRFFLRLLTSAWVKLSLVGACLWVKMPAVIAMPFLKTRFIRHEGKFLKTFRWKNLVSETAVEIIEELLRAMVFVIHKEFLPQCAQALNSQKKNKIIFCRCSVEISLAAKFS